MHLQLLGGIRNRAHSDCKYPAIIKTQDKREVPRQFFIKVHGLKARVFRASSISKARRVSVFTE
jgi:hypothetical protein